MILSSCPLAAFFNKDDTNVSKFIRTYRLLHTLLSSQNFVKKFLSHPTVKSAGASRTLISLCNLTDSALTRYIEHTLAVYKKSPEEFLGNKNVLKNTFMKQPTSSASSNNEIDSDNSFPRLEVPWSQLPEADQNWLTKTLLEGYTKLRLRGIELQNEYMKLQNGSGPALELT